MKVLPRFTSIFLFVISSLFYSSQSFAENYYWVIPYPPDQARYSSAVEACSANRSYYLSNTGHSLVSTDYRFTTDGIGYYCYIQLRRPNSTVYWTGNTASRRGTTCTDPDVYNAETGGCEAPAEPNGEVCGPKDQHTGLPKIKNSAGECVDFPFADRPSQCKFAESRVREATTTVQFDSNGVPSGPPSIDVKGCIAVPVGPNPY